MAQKHDDSDEPKTYPLSAGISFPFEVQQSVGQSLSLPYDVLESIGAGLDLPTEVVQAAADELAALPVKDLEEVRSILERARETGARAVEYSADLARRVQGSNAVRVMTRGLDNASRIDTAIRLIEYVLRHLP